jgi:hypothetical protein
MMPAQIIRWRQVHYSRFFINQTDNTYDVIESIYGLPVY